MIPDLRPSDRDLAYLSYRNYCAGIGQEPLEQHEYEIKIAAMTFPAVGPIGDA